MSEPNYKEISAGAIRLAQYAQQCPTPDLLALETIQGLASALNKLATMVDAMGRTIDELRQCEAPPQPIPAESGAEVPRPEMPRDERAVWLFAMLQDPKQSAWRVSGGYHAEPYTNHAALSEVIKAVSP